MNDLLCDYKEISEISQIEFTHFEVSYLALQI